MFDLSRAYNDITLDEIRSRVSDYELWRRYCSNFEAIDKPFKSELYDDKNPDCRIFKHPNGALIYKDFGDRGKVYNITQYIMTKYACNYQECLNIICTDFNLRKAVVEVDRTIRTFTPQESLLYKPKSVIDIISQPFNLTDYNYWDQYHIPLTMLQEYNVFSAQRVYLYKSDKTIVFTYNNTNPIYAYRFESYDSSSYKIYRPYNTDKKYKWLYSGKSSDVEGYDQLSLSGDTLILTKSLKDCMVYRVLGYDAISLQGETNKLDSEFVQKLKRRFNRIIVNYDNDEEGIRGSKRLYNQYKFNYFLIDGEKDISDYVKQNGLKEGKKMIKNKIGGLVEYN